MRIYDVELNSGRNKPMKEKISLNLSNRARDDRNGVIKWVTTIHNTTRAPTIGASITTIQDHIAHSERRDCALDSDPTIPCEGLVSKAALAVGASPGPVVYARR